MLRRSRTTEGAIQIPYSGSRARPVFVDTNGDGIADCVAIDTTGDGVVDTLVATVDTTGDGNPDSLAVDTVGDGVVDTMISVSQLGGAGNEDGPVTPVAFLRVDTCGDGEADHIAIDTTGDNRVDTIVPMPKVAQGSVASTADPSPSSLSLRLATTRRPTLWKSLVSVKSDVIAHPEQQAVSELSVEQMIVDALDFES